MLDLHSSIIPCYAGIFFAFKECQPGNGLALLLNNYDRPKSKHFKQTSCTHTATDAHRDNYKLHTTTFTLK